MALSVRAVTLPVPTGLTRPRNRFVKPCHDHGRHICTAKKAATAGSLGTCAAIMAPGYASERNSARQAEYRAALDGTPIRRTKQAAVGTLQWLWERYRETTVWTALSRATRRQRENIMRHVLLQSGHEQAAAIKRQHVVAGRDRRARTPAQARNFLDAVRGLFRWALDAGHVKSDPTSGVKNPPRPKTAGSPVWTEDDVDQYERRWPIGTKERVWLAVLLYTGLRRGDAVRLGRQHIRHGVATLRTEKTGVTVTIPILPVLDEVLKAGPCADLAFRRTVAHSQKNHSAMYFATPATRRVSRSRRMACARSALPEAPTMPRPSRS